MAYVDKDKLPYIFAKAINKFDDTFVPISEVAIKVGQIISNLPTADVAEVKHGKWKKSGNEKECSVCKFIYYSNNDDFNYCSNCGAKMDGGKQDDL